MATEIQKNFAERRQNFMERYHGDPILTKTIPEVAAQLFYDEFGVNIYDHSHIPIVFETGWKKILEFVGSQPGEEFAINVCGVSLEYMTEYSESDKSTNIVPQMFNTKAPIFTKSQHNAVSGATYTDNLLEKYSVWRSENLAESVNKIESEIYASLIEDFGIDLMVSAAVLPIIAATYVAGLQVARESRQTVNMYNIFEIDVLEDDKVVLTPLSTVKQYLKNDSKK